MPLSVVSIEDSAVSSAYDGYALVLVRPDGHVAWRGQALPDDCRQLIDHVCGRLERAAILEEAAA